MYATCNQKRFIALIRVAYNKMGKSSATIIMFPCFAQLEQGLVVSDVQSTNILIVSNFESNLDVYLSTFNN